MAAEYAQGNAMSLKRLQDDPNVELRRFPDEVLQLLKSMTRDVVKDLMAADPASAKIGKAYFDYLELAAENSRVTERAYLEARDQG